MGKTGCCVFSCKPMPYNGRYAFPNPRKHPETFKLWKKLLINKNINSFCTDLEIYQRYRVCEAHFQFTDFRISGMRKIINYNTIPSRNLPNFSNSSQEEHQESASSFESTAVEDDNSVESLAEYSTHATVQSSPADEINTNQKKFDVKNTLQRNTASRLLHQKIETEKIKLVQDMINIIDEVDSLEKLAIIKEIIATIAPRFKAVSNKENYTSTTLKLNENLSVNISR